MKKIFLAVLFLASLAKADDFGSNASMYEIPVGSTLTFNTNIKLDIGKVIATIDLTPQQIDENKKTVCYIYLKENVSGVIWNSPITIIVNRISGEHGPTFEGTSNKSLLKEIYCRRTYFDPSTNKTLVMDIRQFSALLEQNGHKLQLTPPIEE